MKTKQKRAILKRSLRDTEPEMYKKYDRIVRLNPGISTSFDVFLTNAEYDELFDGYDEYGSSIFDFSEADINWLYKQLDKDYYFTMTCYDNIEEVPLKKDLYIDPLSKYEVEKEYNYKGLFKVTIYGDFPIEGDIEIEKELTNFLTEEEISKIGTEVQMTAYRGI